MPRGKGSGRVYCIGQQSYYGCRFWVFFWVFWSFWASVLVASKGVVVLVCGEYMDRTETIPSVANCSLC